MNPAVTVSLVTYNGLNWLAACLDSLSAQTMVDFDLIVLDNASDDGTANWLRDRTASKLDPQIQLTCLDTNLGYAAAHNRNIELARGKIVVLLNQDVQLDTDYLAAVVGAFEGDASLGAVQGRISRLSRDGERLPIIDTTGLVIQRDRRVTSRDQGRADELVSRPPGEVWGVDGPVATYRKSALQDARLPRSDGGGVEILDEDFFMYKEDVDLAWRLHRLGWATRYEPSAIAWHARTADGPTGTGWRAIVARNRATPPWIRRLSWRNQRLMQLKNDSARDVLHDLPWIVRREVLSMGYMVIADPRQLMAVPDLVRGLPAAARKRRHLRRRLGGR